MPACRSLHSTGKVVEKIGEVKNPLKVIAIFEQGT
jgi:hypothetical protein